MLKKKTLTVAVVLFLVLVLAACKADFLSDLYPVNDSISIQGDSQKQESETGDTNDLDKISEASTDLSESWIYVHVCGCVRNPGLYRLEKGDRIDAAIKAAGGFSKEADEKSVNLALPLEDGIQIEVLSNSTPEVDNSSQDSRINLNQADKEDLMTLNGIGENRALAIINYREEHGKFSSVEELKDVEGIGEGIYRKIKNDVKI